MRHVKYKRSDGVTKRKNMMQCLRDGVSNVPLLYLRNNQKIKVNSKLIIIEVVMGK